jgi:hypothetical protein
MLYLSCLSCLVCLVCLLPACSGGALPEGTRSLHGPDLRPDYAGCVLPPNIAPPGFSFTKPETEGYALLEGGGKSLKVKAGKGRFRIPAAAWKELLQGARGKDVSVSVWARRRGEGWVSYAPFLFHVAEEPIDPWVAYRLIEPGYELWNRMGLYQRNLENYTETPIIENKMTGKNCMNCHSFRMQDPASMLFHLRATYPATLVVNGQKIEKLNTQTPHTISALVYPSWHPSGRFVAFSVNQTKQAWHHNDPNRVEVFDEASDVVVYDLERHEIITTPSLFSAGAFETFPTFSPDGKRLYFCSAPAQPMPQSFREVRYSLCSLAFDPLSGVFGSEVDTLWQASAGGRSASFPRVSPDGKFLLYTLSGYGNFSIWHKDADLQLMDLSSGANLAADALNSEEVDSYHSWSSNSRWVIFSSRRLDGLYTRLFIAYIDREGKASKPFVLPQKDTDFYHRFMKSYNIPEFITGKVTVSARRLALKARNDPGINPTFSLR